MASSVDQVAETLQVDAPTVAYHIPEPQPLTQFHLFPSLPVELRQAIWDLFLIPHIVLLKWSIHFECVVACFPILFHINRESREYGTLRYRNLTAFDEKLADLWFEPDADLGVFDFASMAGLNTETMSDIFTVQLTKLSTIFIHAGLVYSAEAAFNRFCALPSTTTSFVNIGWDCGQDPDNAGTLAEQACAILERLNKLSPASKQILKWPMIAAMPDGTWKVDDLSVEVSRCKGGRIICFLNLSYLRKPAAQVDNDTEK